MTHINFPKNAIVGVDQLVSKVSHSMNSHQGSWFFLLVNQLKYLGYENARVCKDSSEWKDLDCLIISHGMNYQGTFNVFGGCQDALAERLEQFSMMPREKILCHDILMPDIGQFVASRKHTGSEWFKSLNTAALTELSHGCQSVFDIFWNQRLVFGDSHSMAYYQSGYMISRNDGLTLHGALEKGLRKFLEKYLPLTHLVICLGNIDIRHHLVRLGITDTSELVARYEQQLKDLDIPNIQIVAPLFIENESRVIPKPGWYKGRPFWGSWEERVAIRSNLITNLRYMCQRNKWGLTPCPMNYANAKGELDFSVMEKPRGVHLSPTTYQWTR